MSRDLISSSSKIFKRGQGRVCLEESSGSSCPFLAFMSSPASSSNALRMSLDTPTWIDFWSEASVDQRRRNSSCSAATTTTSSSSQERKSLQMIKPSKPFWNDEYINVNLRRCGNHRISTSGMFEKELVMLDNQAVFDDLLLKAYRFSDLLRKVGSEIWG
ncbi:hypothetical protein QQ045_019392 [Rhodiola kirilowii]